MKRITSLKETGIHTLPEGGTFKSVDDFILQDESLDLRGRQLIQDGQPDDTVVTDMLVDPDTHRVVLIELSDQRRIPIEWVRLQGSFIRLEHLQTA